MIPLRQSNPRHTVSRRSSRRSLPGPWGTWLIGLVGVACTPTPPPPPASPLPLVLDETYATLFGFREKTPGPGATEPFPREIALDSLRFNQHLREAPLLPGARPLLLLYPTLSPTQATHLQPLPLLALVSDRLREAGINARIDTISAGPALLEPALLRARPLLLAAHLDEQPQARLQLLDSEGTALLELRCGLGASTPEAGISLARCLLASTAFRQHAGVTP